MMHELSIHYSQNIFMKWGLCKTWTLDWTGLTKTAVYRQWTPPRLQQLVPSSASSCFLAVESSRQRLLDFWKVKGHVHIL